MMIIVQSALEYTSRGWAVFPLHTPTEAGCSCGKPNCQHAGKHPRAKHGFHDSVTDEITIREWWTRWPDTNIGIVTGGMSGLVVLDIDPRHGGDETLASLERQHGPLPDTIERLTSPGDLVLDPPLGGGTTGVAAVELRRNFVGIEVDAAALATAEARIRKAEEGGT